MLINYLHADSQIYDHLVNEAKELKIDPDTHVARNGNMFDWYPLSMKSITAFPSGFKLDLKSQFGQEVAVELIHIKGTAAFKAGETILDRLSENQWSVRIGLLHLETEEEKPEMKDVEYKKAG